MLQYVEAVKQLLIALGRQLADAESYGVVRLLANQRPQLVRSAVSLSFDQFRVGVGLSSGFLSLLPDQDVEGRLLDEASNRGGVVDASAPQSCQDDTEGFLMDIVRLLRASRSIAQHRQQGT